MTPVQRMKLELLTDGMVVSDRARAALTGGDPDCPLTMADYASTSGLSMRLEDDVWVNAPLQEFNPNFVSATDHLLDHENGKFFVSSRNRTFRAHPTPVASYHDQKNRWGEPFTQYAHTHTDRVRISPVDGCAVACKFCNIPYDSKYTTRRIEGLTDAVRRALEDERVPARHVLISGGTPRPEDYDFLNETYRRTVETFPGVDVDIMMMPAPGLLDLERLKAVGIHGLSINLEIFDSERAARIMKGKARLSRDGYLDFIERAVGVFGPGRVRSLILVGLEDLEQTLAGVEALAARGCDPVLSPFRPDPVTPLRNERPPSVELLAEAYERSRELAERHGVKLGPRCIPCMHNTLTFPDGSGDYYESCPSPTARCSGPGQPD